MQSHKTLSPYRKNVYQTMSKGRRTRPEVPSVQREEQRQVSIHDYHDLLIMIFFPQQTEYESDEQSYIADEVLKDLSLFLSNYFAINVPKHIAYDSVNSGGTGWALIKKQLKDYKKPFFISMLRCTVDHDLQKKEMATIAKAIWQLYGNFCFIEFHVWKYVPSLENSIMFDTPEQYVRLVGKGNFDTPKKKFISKLGDTFRRMFKESIINMKPMLQEIVIKNFNLESILFEHCDHCEEDIINDKELPSNLDSPVDYGIEEMCCEDTEDVDEYNEETYDPHQIGLGKLDLGVEGLGENNMEDECIDENDILGVESDESTYDDHTIEDEEEKQSDLHRAKMYEK